MVTLLETMVTGLMRVAIRAVKGDGKERFKISKSYTCPFQGFGSGIYMLALL